jgi:uncharacterized protein
MPLESRLNYVVKVASQCNLNCSYCYVYNQADTTWRERGGTMSRETFEAMIERIRRHCLLSGQEEVQLAFHGGEPTLVGPARLAWMCATARERLGELAEVGFSMQTNGTRLNETWVSVLAEHDVRVSVSLDGPREINDVHRVDRSGRGSHDAVLRGISLLRAAEVPFGILSVVQLGAEPLVIHRHFLELGAASIGYLLPSYTHDTIGAVRSEFGPTPVADFLIPIFEDWWFNSSIEVSIREFWNLARLIMGGSTRLDTIGNPPLRFVAVESDGAIFGLDKLRSCEDGMAAMGLSVHDADFREIADAAPFHAAVLAGLPLPSGCGACPERDTCAGGHLPNRYSKARGFDNPSVWCADLLALFAHIRGRMGISHEETRLRRESLRQSREQALAAVEIS